MRLRAICAGALVVILAMSLVSLALADDPSFSDVPATHPYYTAITDLASRDIIGGYGNGNFGPGDPVKRQQFAKMIVLTAGYPVSEADICRFKDVEKSTTSLYPDNYVAVCAANGITTGKTSTTFDPYSSITRYQVISMVVRTAQDLQPGLLVAPPSGWTATHGWGSDPTHGANAKRAEYNGLLDGLDLSALSPQGTMSRGEVAQVLHNLLVLLPTSGSTTTVSPSTTTSTDSTTTTTTTDSTTTTSSSTTSTTSTTVTSLPAGAGYENMLVTISGPPSVDAYMTGGLDVFARDPNGELISTWYDGIWNDWEYLSGVTLAAGSGPASAASSYGALDVFVRGSDDCLHHRQYTDDWTDWENLGGVLTSDPAVATQSAGQLDVFWRGPLDHLYHRACHAMIWSPQEDLGGTLLSEPAATSWGANRIDVFALAAGNTLWHTWWDGAVWREENLGGALTSGPAVCSRGANLLDVFARGAGDTIWHISYNGTAWSPWEDLGGAAVASAPDVASWGSSRMDLFVQGTDGKLWHRWWEGAGWLPAF